MPDLINRDELIEWLNQRNPVADHMVRKVQSMPSQSSSDVEKESAWEGFNGFVWDEGEQFIIRNLFGVCSIVICDSEGTYRFFKYDYDRSIKFDLKMLQGYMWAPIPLYIRKKSDV